MYHIRVVSDLDECRRVWQYIIPGEYVSDLWEFRACFQRHYRRPPYFIVAEQNGKVQGLLPLSWIEESRCYGYFPGEVWAGKTWLEQNRLIAGEGGVMESMFGHLNDRRLNYHLRYLLPVDSWAAGRETVDEVGYLFHPPQFGFDMENYFQLFSHKSAKRIKREVADIEALGARFRHDCLEDFDLMVRLNVDRYGAASYFADNRFLESFRDMTSLLADRGWLRITTVLIGDEPAAVDLGCIYRGMYTLLGGGTNAKYPGIAKLINLCHMRRACEEKWDQVDFLCGNFSWKTMFHLSPRPLYKLSNVIEGATGLGISPDGPPAMEAAAPLGAGRSVRA